MRGWLPASEAGMPDPGRILVDGDACPARALILREAGDLPVLWFSTADHAPPAGAVWIEAPSGPDATDHILFAHTRPGDLVITQDYGLAALCLARAAWVLHPEGWRYRPETIDALLQERYLAARTRRAGGRTRGPRARDAGNDRALRDSMLEWRAAQN